MRNTITEILESVSSTHGVRVLLAVESGSRAWGFPSTDSDYDVRFLYVHEVEWYLALHEERDVIEYASGGDLLDLNGWELRKALRLLVKGNAAVYEWLQSPVVYKADEAFVKRTWEIAQKFFPLKAGLHHYLGVVRGVLDEFASPQLKVKRLFYGLRAALAARWIIEKQTVPPMAFDALKVHLPVRAELLALAETLRSEKARNAEAFSVLPPPLFRAYFEEAVRAGDKISDTLPDPIGNRKVINAHFCSIILSGNTP